MAKNPTKDTETIIKSDFEDNPFSLSTEVPVIPQEKKETPQPIQKREVETTQTEQNQQPTLVMSELDSIIRERIKSQPSTIEQVDIAVSRVEAPGLHRLSLPPYFEQFSYDCTRGDVCEYHARDKKTGKIISGRGRYIMRWIMKDKRAIDPALNVRGWYLVNRSYFPEAPKMLFGTSGGVETGDLILVFMTVEKALAIRKFPQQKSRDLLNSRMTPSKKKPNRILMTGNPDDENVYEPDMGGDEAETGEGTAAIPGSLQEGRDF